MTDKKLTNREVSAACNFWWATSHTTYNYQRLQAGSMTSMLAPLFSKWYGDNSEKLIEGLKRQLLYFNTEPRFGAIIPGIVVALEEGIATSEGEVDATTVADIKTALMGPLAGIGDTVWAGLIKPLILSVTCAWAIQGYIWGSFVYGIGVTLLDYFVTRTTFMYGYRLGINSIDRFLEGDFVKKVTTVLGIIGLFCVGAMVVKYINFNFVIQITSGATTLDVGGILNRIMPKLLPLA